MALVDNLIPLRARLGALPVRLGVPQYQSTIVLFHNNAYTVLSPRPKIERVSPTGTELFFAAGTYITDSVQLQGDELLVSGIPRTYDLDLLKEAVWIVDAVANGSGGYTGTRCTCEWVDRNQVTVWSVVLQPRKVI